MINLSRHWKSMNSLFKGGIFCLLLAGLTSCGLNAPNSSSSSGNQLTVIMHDSPALYNSVILNISGVDVKSSLSGGNWIPLSNQSTSYNLVTLVNGQYAVLGQYIGLPSGTYDLLRLKLGTGDQVGIGSKTYDLKIDTTVNPDFDLSINSQIDNQHNSVVVLDFDVPRSVSLSKDSTFILKPYIRTDELISTGYIQGSINQPAAVPVLYAINSGDTLTSTYADATGGFVFFGIRAGTYDVAVHPLAGNYKDTTLTNVQVTANQTTQLTSIDLKTK